MGLKCTVEEMAEWCQKQPVGHELITDETFTEDLRGDWTRIGFAMEQAARKPIQDATRDVRNAVVIYRTAIDAEDTQTRVVAWRDLVAANSALDEAERTNG